MPGFDDMYQWGSGGDPGDGYYAAEREAVQGRKGKLRKIMDYGKPFLDGLRSNAGQVSGQQLSQDPNARASQMSGGYDVGARPDPWAQAISTGMGLFQNGGR